MSVHLNPANISYKSNLKFQNFQKFQNNPMGCKGQNNDLVNNEPNSLSSDKKTGKVQGFKNFVAAVKKTWITVSEYTKGVVGGLLKGGILGGITYGAIKTGKAIKAAKIADGRILDKINTGLKNSTPKLLGKTVSIGVVVATLAHSIYKKSLVVSERKADIDHKYNTGHRFE